MDLNYIDPQARVLKYCFKVIKAIINEFDMTTSAIGCNEEAYIDHLLRKYGLDQCNATKLPMNPGTVVELQRETVFIT